MKKRYLMKCFLTLNLMGVGGLLIGCGGGSSSSQPASTTVVSGTPGGMLTTAGGCYSQGSQQGVTLGFTGTGIYYDGVKLYGGQIPTIDNIGGLQGAAMYGALYSGLTLSQGGVSYGMFSLGAGTTITGSTNTFVGKSITDGLIQLSFTSINNQPVTTTNLLYSQIGQANVSGTITVSPTKLAALSAMGGQFSSQVCFTGMAISLTIYPSQGLLYAGRVYLYSNMNGTTQPLFLQF